MLINYAKNKNGPLIIGVCYCFVLYLASLFQTVFHQHYFVRAFDIGIKMKSALMSMIYRKSFLLSNDARRTATVGQMINILSVNTQCLVEFPHHLAMAFTSPFLIMTVIYFLYMKLGLGAIAGVLMMVFLIPITSFLTSKHKSLQTVKLKHQDSRIRIINEVLNGIKVLI
jgi:ATP-binding cassette subfamily C (CFTR/MRP) protein 1